MGYNIKQKIEICLKAEAEPHLTQMDLAHWAMKQYGSSKPPSQTTISRILSSKNDIIGSKEADFLLVRRRKQTNPLLRKILTEWITQAHWEQIPITTPIIQLTAYAIWTRLPTRMKDGNGLFNHKWCNNFVKKLNINLTGTPETIRENLGYKLNKEWKLDEKLELKNYIRNLIAKENYSPRDIFTIDEFSLFYLLPLDQIFDILSIDKGLKQSSSSTENMLTIMLGCNVDGSEKLNPLVVSKHETFDVSDSCHASLKANNIALLTPQALINKVGEVYLITYKSNNNKWITSSMFQDYLLTLDHKLENSTPNRNILILLDNSSSHRMINLEFKHIRLVYLENTSKHKNPFNGSNSAKFDYLPMSFGIVEEFKILYRLQQYLEMINKQRRNVELDQSTLPVLGSSLNLPKIEGANNSEVLSESDYQVPFIKVIEWIRRSWESIRPQIIFRAWKQTYLLSLTQPWPASNPQVVQQAKQSLNPLLESLKVDDSQKSYKKLNEIMDYLNVVIRWEIDDLLGLVNERSKVSLSYASIEEIIGSCVLGQAVDEDESKETKTFPQPDMIQDSWLSPETPGITLPEPKFNANFSSRIPDHSRKTSTSSMPISLAPMSPITYVSQTHPRIPPNIPLSLIGLNSKFRDVPSNEYAGGSPGSMNMNALLMATSMSKHDDKQQSFSPLAPIKQDILPPVLSRVEMNGVQLPERRGRIGDLDDLHSRKRAHYYHPNNQGGQNSPAYFPINSVNVLSLSNELNTDFTRNFNAGFPGNLGNLRQQLNERVSNPSPLDGANDAELINVLNRIIDASDTEGLKLSSFALEELKSNLSKIQHKYGANESPTEL